MPFRLLTAVVVLVCLAGRGSRDFYKTFPFEKRLVDDSAHPLVRTFRFELDPEKDRRSTTGDVTVTYATGGDVVVVSARFELSDVVDAVIPHAILHVTYRPTQKQREQYAALVAQAKGATDGEVGRLHLVPDAMPSRQRFEVRTLTRDGQGDPWAITLVDGFQTEIELVPDAAGGRPGRE